MYVYSITIQQSINSVPFFVILRLGLISLWRHDHPPLPSMSSIFYHLFRIDFRLRRYLYRVNNNMYVEYMVRGHQSHRHHPPCLNQCCYLNKMHQNFILFVCLLLYYHIEVCMETMSIGKKLEYTFDFYYKPCIVWCRWEIPYQHNRIGPHRTGCTFLTLR